MNSEQRQFIERVGALAAADMQASGILASLTIAQAILESGWGTSELAQNANALFGIKADSRWSGKAYSKDTKECYDGVNYTTVTALFRAYGSWEESVADHSAFLRTGNRYAAVIGEKDYKAACKAIKAAGYATAPDYADKLVSLIEGYGLTSYDGDDAKGEKPLEIRQLFLTENACYKSGRTIKVKGIMVHSTGANNPNLCRYVGPDDGIVGQNRYNNHWNTYHPGGREICVHGFIGKDKNGVVRAYQTLPWDMRGWHCAGAGNDTHISFEICEDDLTSRDYFEQCYEMAVQLCSHLCKEFNLDPNKDGVLICHSEGHARGIASNHGDVMHWWPKHGKTMDDFRRAVRMALNGDGGSNGTTTPTEPENPSTGPSDGGNATFSVGDVLQFKGGPHYKSSNAAAASGTPAAGPAKLTALAAGAKHPYHVIHTDKQSAVYGWVDAEDVEKASTGGGETSSGSTYTVKRGDCLSAIGAALGVDWREIASLNGISTPYTIYTGQVLKIPHEGAQAATWREYTVKKGDSLWAIAAKLLGNGSRYKEIKELSGLTSDTIHAGDVLKVPAK